MSDTGTDGVRAWLGRTIDERYVIERLLGEGGMGAVYAARQVRLDKPVALKVILPEHAGNAELASRFAREAMITAKLDHPHIVSAIDTGPLPEGGAYLVMQLAAGTSLRSLVRAKRGWRVACDISSQLADALTAAHALGVVHRDLKPENVMVEERDDGSFRARVLDFGIARAADAGAGDKALTRLGTILGTPGYMPPEQGLGDLVDHRADLYSLGVILFELITGRALFADKDFREIALAQLTEPVPVLDLPDAPPELEALLDGLLQPKKENRPERAVDVRDALRRLAATPGGAGPVARGSGLPASEAASPSPSSSPALATAATAFASPGSMPGVVAAPTPAPMLATRSQQPARFVLPVLSVGAVLAALTLGVWMLPGGESASESGSESRADLSFDDVPAELRADLGTVIASGDATSRVGAAARLASVRERLPTFATHVADLELARTCDDRRDAVRALREDRDPRATPALERLAAQPTTGCAPSGRGDCLRCLRRDLDRALETLRESPDGETHDDDRDEN